MSIVQTKEVTTGSSEKKVEAVLLRAPVNKDGTIQAEIASYTESDATKQVSDMILKHFVLGTVNLYTPRVEFND